MAQYILKRVLLMIPVIIGVTLLIFLLQAVTPGDPATLVLGIDAPEEMKEEWRDQYNLNDPILVQYVKYMGGVIKGDFGVSYRTGKNITQTILERWPTTFILATLTVIIAATLGVVLGIIAALKRNTWIDSVARLLGMLGVSMPNFWFALLLILQFGLKLKWFPISGLYGPEYWVLPAVSAGVLGSAYIMRVTRSAMLDNIYSDFVRTARSKGQSEKVIVVRHILRNALIPISNSIGGQFASSLGGTVVLEQIFSIAGLGTLMVDAIYGRDYPLLRGSVILVALTVSIINLLIDLFYAAIDPRVKSEFKSGKDLFRIFRKKPAQEKG